MRIEWRSRAFDERTIPAAVCVYYSSLMQPGMQMPDNATGRPQRQEMYSVPKITSATAPSDQSTAAQVAACVGDGSLLSLGDRDDPVVLLPAAHRQANKNTQKTNDY